jgi:hypothetical protein
MHFLFLPGERRRAYTPPITDLEYIWRWMASSDRFGQKEKTSWYPVDTRLCWARATLDAMSKRKMYESVGNESQEAQPTAVDHADISAYNINHIQQLLMQISRPIITIIFSSCSCRYLGLKNQSYSAVAHADISAYNINHIQQLIIQISRPIISIIFSSFSCRYIQQLFMQISRPIITIISSSCSFRYLGL